MPYFVYILRTSKNTLYIGQTNNLEKRIKEHKGKRGAKYLRFFKSFKLVYKELLETRSAALKREYQLKQFSKLEKEELINFRN